MVAAVIVLAVSPPYAVLLVARLLMGAGMGLWALSRMQYMRRVTPRHQRGRIMSLFGGTNRDRHVHRSGGRRRRSQHAGVRAVVPDRRRVHGRRVDPRAAVSRRSRQQRRKHPVGGEPAARSSGDVASAPTRAAEAGTGHIFAQAIRSGRPVVLPLYGAFVLGWTRWRSALS